MSKNVHISTPEFRARLTSLREDASLSKAELAARAGVAYRTVLDIESGKRGRAQEKTLCMLADALGVSLTVLLHGEASPASTADTPPVPATRARRPMPVLLIAAVVVLGLAVVGFGINEWITRVTVTERPLAVSVVNFQNLVDPADPDRLGIIARDLVINELSESRYVRVVSRHGLPGIDPDVPHDVELKSAKSAGVARVLFGSILQVEPRLVLASRLENAADGTVMATQTVTATEDETFFDAATRLAAHVKRDLVLPRGEETERGLPIARVTTRSIHAYRHYVEGVDYLNKLYRKEARSQFRQAVAHDSTFAMAMTMLVHPEIVGAPGERDSLLARARRHAAGLTPRERYYLEAFEAWSRGNVKDAIDVCEALVEDYPQESEGYRLLARFYHSRRRDTAAISALETAVEVDPFDGMSLNRLGYQYVRTGRYDRALDCMNRYVRLAPSEANPYDSRGDLLAWTGNPEAAIDSYRMALDRNPSFFPAMQNLGCVLTLTGRYAEAEKYFRRMLDSEDGGSRSRARWFLGMMDVYRGRLDAAEKKLERAMVADDIEQQRSDAYLNKLCAIARIQCARGDSERGLATYRAAIDTLQRYHPGDISEWPVSYSCTLSSVDIAAAEAFRDSLADHIRTGQENQNHVLWACDGWIQLRKGDAAAACRAFERAVGDYDVFHYRYPLGLAYLEAGRIDDAIHTFEYSVNRYSSGRILNAIWGVKMYYHLGRAYELAGRHDDARAMYSRFLEIWDGADPAFDEIGDAYGRVAVLDQGL